MKNNNSANDPLSPLSTADLFELASLDAMGLLDEAERRRFERDFAAAPPALQAQLRAQQDLMSEEDATLPRVEVPHTLRAKVLAAVAAAFAASRLHEAGRTTPAFLPGRRVNRFWRAAAIGCAAAAVAFGVVSLEMQWRFRDLDAALRTNAATEVLIRDFGPRFEQQLLNPNTKFVQFTPGAKTDSKHAPGLAVLLVDPTNKSAQFFGKDLPEQEGSYQLVVVGPDGTAREAILTFRAAGTRIAQEIRNFEIPGGSTLAITTAGPSGSTSPVTLLKSTSL